MDQGSTRKRSAVHNFAPTVTKFCVMWEGQALPHDTKFGNSRCEIVGRRVIFIWSLIHGSSWSGLIKVRPGETIWRHRSGLILARVMSCYMTAPSHYLSQCWVLISEALWHWPESALTGSPYEDGAGVSAPPCPSIRRYVRPSVDQIVSALHLPKY